MIKNIVFDMGGVLIRFDPDYFMERLGIAKEDRQLVNRSVFRTIEWVRMDRGTLADEEALKIFLSRLPERLHEAVRTLVMSWERPILPIEGMETLIERLSQSGYQIFLLSNASHRQHEYWPDIPVSRFFKDTLISCDVQVIKPQPEIYRRALEKFHIQAEETVFIDDLPVNCEAAQGCGIRAFVFNGDAAQLEEWLKKQGVDL